MVKLRKDHVDKLMAERRTKIMSRSSVDKDNLSVSTSSDDSTYNALQKLKDQIDEYIYRKKYVELTSVVQKVKITLQDKMNEQPFDKFIATGLLNDVFFFLASLETKPFLRLKEECMMIVNLLTNGDASIITAILDKGYLDELRRIIIDTSPNTTIFNEGVISLINILGTNESPNIAVCPFTKTVFESSLVHLIANEVRQHYIGNREICANVCWMMSNSLRGPMHPRVKEGIDPLKCVLDCIDSISEPSLDTTLHAIWAIHFFLEGRDEIDQRISYVHNLGIMKQLIYLFVTTNNDEIIRTCLGIFESITSKSDNLSYFSKIAICRILEKVTNRDAVVRSLSLRATYNLICVDETASMIAEFIDAQAFGELIARLQIEDIEIRVQLLNVLIAFLKAVQLHQAEEILENNTHGIEIFLSLLSDSDPKRSNKVMIRALTMVYIFIDMSDIKLQQGSQNMGCRETLNCKFRSYILSLPNIENIERCTHSNDQAVHDLAQKIYSDLHSNC